MWGFKHYIVGIFALQLVFNAHTASAESCEDGQTFSHEYDCTKFYICSNGMKEPAQCAPGLQFQETIGSCDWSSEDCNIGIDTTSMEPPVETEQPACTENESTPHESDCTTFYICVKGEMVLGHCPPEYHYDPEVQGCEWANGAVCETEATEAPEEPTTVEEITEPEPEPTTSAPETCIEGESIPNSNDCTTFFVCVNGKLQTGHCPPEYHYDPNTGGCKYANGESCESEITEPPTAPPTSSPEPETTTPKPTQKPTTAKPTTEAPTNPEPDCSGSQMYWPHPNDCTKFYQCSNGKPYLFDCPAGLHFNPTLNVCDWPHSAGCSGPKCGSEDYLSHESDCGKFYQCSNGTPVEKSCPSGLHFNPTIKVCDWPQNAGCM